MESNKLEQDFKSKMEQRTIQPTEMAWDRLDAMLSVAEGKKKKPNRAWMYMAASFLALLLVGTLFLNQQKNGINNGTTNANSVVTTNNQPVINTGTSVNRVNTDGIKAQDGVATTTIDTPVKPDVKNTAVAVYNTTATIRNKKSGITTATVPTAKHTIVTMPATNQEVAQNTTAPYKVEAPAVKPLPQSVRVDANALLASVEKTSVTIISTNTATAVSVKQPGVKVNANSLLSSVEGELDESFRGKVLQTVAKNYNIVKTSVASRNRQ